MAGKKRKIDSEAAPEYIRVTLGLKKRMAAAIQKEYAACGYERQPTFGELAERAWSAYESERASGKSQGLNTVFAGVTASTGLPENVVARLESLRLELGEIIEEVRNSGKTGTGAEERAVRQVAEAERVAAAGLESVGRRGRTGKGRVRRS